MKDIVDLSTIEIPQIFIDFTLKDNSSFDDIKDRFKFLSSEGFLNILDDLELSIEGGLEECLKIEKLVNKLMLLEAALFNIHYIQDFIRVESWIYTPTITEQEVDGEIVEIDATSLDNLSSLVRRILRIKKELNRINELQPELEPA